MWVTITKFHNGLAITLYVNGCVPRTLEIKNAGIPSIKKMLTIAQKLRVQARSMRGFLFPMLFGPKNHHMGFLEH